MHLNPVRSGLVKRPQDWRWSSYNNFSLDKTTVYESVIVPTLNPKRAQVSGAAYREGITLTNCDGSWHLLHDLISMAAFRCSRPQGENGSLGECAKHVPR